MLFLYSYAFYMSSEHIFVFSTVTVHVRSTLEPSPMSLKIGMYGHLNLIFRCLDGVKSQHSNALINVDVLSSMCIIPK